MQFSVTLTKHCWNSNDTYFGSLMYCLNSEIRFLSLQFFSDENWWLKLTWEIGCISANDIRAFCNIQENHISIIQSLLQKLLKFLILFCSWHNFFRTCTVKFFTFLYLSVLLFSLFHHVIICFQHATWILLKKSCLDKISIIETKEVTVKLLKTGNKLVQLQVNWEDCLRLYPDLLRFIWRVKTRVWLK